MKKMLLSFAVLAAFGAKAQLMNGDFEAGAVTHPYSSAGLPNIGATSGWDIGVYDEETAAPYAGTRSLKMATVNDPDMASTFGLPSDNVSGQISQSINGPVTNPGDITMDFMFKFTSVGGDSAVVVLEVYDTLLAGLNDDELLYQGVAVVPTSVSAWTAGNVSVQDVGGTGTPNQIYIVSGSSLGGIFTDGQEPNPGSTLWLDNIVLNTDGSTAGLNENAISATVYPNPTSDVLNIKSSEGIASVTITSMDGKVVASANTSSIAVSELNAGMYLYTATTVTGKIANGNFVKK